MIRLGLLLGALTLAGCTPTMYLPHPLPTPPMRTGAVASGELDLAARATTDLSVRPVQGLSAHARIYAGNSGADQNNEPDTITGGEVGATFLYDFRERTLDNAVRLLPTAEVGGATGRDRMGSQGADGITDRYAVHGGLVWSNVDRHIGLLVRLTSVSTHDVVQTDSNGGTYGRSDDQATFLEPVVRFGHQTDRTEFSAQVGISYDLNQSGDDYYRYSYVPFIFQARVGIRLADF